MTTIVLDTSVATAWALLETDDPAADTALNLVQKGAALVPALFWFELRNALVVSERRNRITPLTASEFLSAFAKFTVLVDREPDELNVMGFARTHGLTVYDACYLELALRANLPLATLDRKLSQAAQFAGVEIVGFALRS